MGGATATFDYTAFVTRYPEFTSVSEALVQLAWTEATLYLDNTGYGPVCDPNQQAMLLNMLTAHIVSLNFGTTGTNATPLVGRIEEAEQGSVSVRAVMPDVATAAWYQQTKYGAAFWQATSVFRLGRFRTGRPRYPWR